MWDMSVSASLHGMVAILASIPFILQVLLTEYIWRPILDDGEEGSDGERR